MRAIDDSAPIAFIKFILDCRNKESRVSNEFSAARTVACDGALLKAPEW